MTISLLVIGVSLLCALPHFALAARPPSMIRSLLKTLPVAGFALSAWLADGPAFLIAALGLSALGDLALSRPGRKSFLYGLAAFGLAHLCYVLLFQALSAAPIGAVFHLHVLPALALIGLAVSTELWLTPHSGALAWPLRAYVLLITAMGLAGLLLPPELALVRLGAGLFIASDLVLAIQLFRLAESRRAHRPAGWAIWALYIGGQFAILWGLIAS